MPALTEGPLRAPLGDVHVVSASTTPLTPTHCQRGLKLMRRPDRQLGILHQVHQLTSRWLACIISPRAALGLRQTWSENPQQGPNPSSHTPPPSTLVRACRGGQPSTPWGAGHRRGHPEPHPGHPRRGAAGSLRGALRQRGHLPLLPRPEGGHRAHDGRVRDAPGGACQLSCVCPRLPVGGVLGPSTRCARWGLPAETSCVCPRLPVGGMLGLAAQLQWLGLGVCRPALWAELGCGACALAWVCSGMGCWCLWWRGSGVCCPFLIGRALDRQQGACPDAAQTARWLGPGLHSSSSTAGKSTLVASSLSHRSTLVVGAGAGRQAGYSPELVLQLMPAQLCMQLWISKQSNNRICHWLSIERASCGGLAAMNPAMTYFPARQHPQQLHWLP